MDKGRLWIELKNVIERFELEKNKCLESLFEDHKY